MDSETAFVFLRARSYDPGVGRFLQRDSFALDSGVGTALNRYIYALDNPTSYIDPSGHFAETVWDVANVMLDAYEFYHDPSMLNGALLIIDIAAMTVPLVPGGAGALVRAEKARQVMGRAARLAGEAFEARMAVRLRELEGAGEMAAKCGTKLPTMERVMPGQYNTSGHGIDLIAKEAGSDKIWIIELGTGDTKRLKATQNGVQMSDEWIKYAAAKLVANPDKKAELQMLTGHTNEREIWNALVGAQRAVVVSDGTAVKGMSSAGLNREQQLYIWK